MDIFLGVSTGGVGLGLWGGVGVAVLVFMFVFATAILIVGRVTPKKVMGMSVLSAAITAIVALLGVAWLADTFVAAHLQIIVNGLDGMVDRFPLFFAVALFFVAALTTSQPVSFTGFNSRHSRSLRLLLG